MSKLNDEVWHELTLTEPQKKSGQVVAEPGRVALLLEGKTLRAHFVLTDSDIFNSATQDGQALCETGDVAELFIGPITEPHGPTPSYLELHLAPTGVRSAYRGTGHGDLIPLDQIPFTGRVEHSGNAGWSGEIAIDVEIMAELLGLTEMELNALSVLAARYNATRSHDPRAEAKLELTMWPPQPRLDFHDRPTHAPLRVGNELPCTPKGAQ